MILISYKRKSIFDKILPDTEYELELEQEKIEEFKKEFLDGWWTDKMIPEGGRVEFSVNFTLKIYNKESVEEEKVRRQKLNELVEKGVTGP